MNRKIIFVVSLLGLFAIEQFAQEVHPFEKQSFNEDWKFLRNEFIDASPMDFNDSEWKLVQLPHDWAIEGPFATEFDARCGGLPYFGTGWYRKHFTLPKAYSGKKVQILFDGAMKNAKVWLNGEYVGERPYGYSSFYFDLTKHLNYGGEKNVITVKLQPEDLSSRWYSGAGIYRNVWLEINNPIHIATWSNYITTPVVTKKSATINTKATIINSNQTAASIEVEYIINNDKKEVVAEEKTKIKLSEEVENLVEHSLKIKDPGLWDITNPVLYTLDIKILAKGELLEHSSSKFGIRTIDFSADKGFMLNNRQVELQGVCMHHDLGPLGAAVNRRAVERQLQIMQSMGVNALRTSHNPPSPEVLEYCDKLGILVIDEAFDCWEMSKVPKDYGTVFKEWYEKDLRDMIRRDRNHPSVIMWSIGNEIMEQGTKKRGRELTRLLSDICHEEDNTRPTTIGFNYFDASIANGLADEIDIVGFNYYPAKYAQVVKNHPEWIIYGSETASTVSSRGEYHFPIEKYTKHPSHQITSYDIVGPPWAYPPDIEFHNQEKTPSVLGEFIWTGFDYLGEPTPFGGRDNQTHGRWKGEWPSRSAYFGAVDLCGFPKDRYYLYKSQWTKEPMVHLLPHWNWELNVGDTIPVYCYTNCDEAELFVNGKSVGKKTKGLDKTPIFVDYYFNEDGPIYNSKYRLSWEVPYKAGNIKVVGYKNGNPVVEKEIKTAGKPAKLKLVADRKVIEANGEDLSFITVQVEDEDGNICPKAGNLVHFDVQGAGEIAAVGNGNPATTQLFNQSYRNAFNGVCMLIVKSKKGEKGEIVIKAKSEGIGLEEIKISTN